MTRDRQSYDDKSNQQPSRNGIELLEAETLRSSCEPRATDRVRSEEKIGLFWRIFGGTILSIAALVVITVFNQLLGTLAELRKDLNQLHENRAELLRKDEFSTRLTSVWNGIKDLQQSNHNLLALNERSKLLDQHLERQIDNGGDERRELSRRLEEQRRALEEERKENQRKLEELRKGFEDERKDLTQKLQGLSERLAKVEGRGSGETAAVSKKQ